MPMSTQVLAKAVLKLNFKSKPVQIVLLGSHFLMVVIRALAIVLLLMVAMVKEMLAMEVRFLLVVRVLLELKVALLSVEHVMVFSARAHRKLKRRTVVAKTHIQAHAMSPTVRPKCGSDHAQMRIAFNHARLRRAVTKRSSLTV